MSVSGGMRSCLQQVGACVYFPVATVQLWWLTVTTDSTCGCVVTIGLQCVASGYGCTVVKDFL